MESSEDIIVDNGVECHESLDQLDKVLVELEQSHDDRAEGTRDITQVIASMQGFLQGDTAVFAAIDPTVVLHHDAAHMAADVGDGGRARHPAGDRRPGHCASRNGRVRCDRQARFLRVKEMGFLPFNRIASA